MSKITESAVEEAALLWFEKLEYDTAYGLDIAPDGPNPLRTNYSDVTLRSHLEAALSRINDTLPYSAIEEVVSKIVRTDSPALVENNRSFHQLLTEGLSVEYADTDGRLVHGQAWLIDFENVDNNDWLVVNQFTVVEENHNRRPDIVVFVNGLPLAVIELKDPTDETATIKKAFKQLQTYKAEIPSLFRFNESLVVSDGIEAKMGYPYRGLGSVHAVAYCGWGNSRIKKTGRAARAHSGSFR